MKNDDVHKKVDGVPHGNRTRPNSLEGCDATNTPVVQVLTRCSKSARGRLRNIYEIDLLN